MPEPVGCGVSTTLPAPLEKDRSQGCQAGNESARNTARVPLHLIQCEHLQSERRVLQETINRARECDRRERTRREIQQFTASVLESSGDPGLRRRAAAMRVCCTSYGVMTHETDPDRTRVVPLNRCWDRLCPSDAARRARGWAEHLGPLIDTAKREGLQVRYFVLPQRTRSGESLFAARQRFERAFRRLTQSRRFKRHVRGWMASREMTWSKGAWNYHVNVIFVGEFWPHGELSDAWRWATDGDSYIVHIQQAYDGVEREAVKYALKIAKLPAERLVEYATTMRGVRLISTGGAWYGAAPAEVDSSAPAGDGWRVVPFETLFIRARQGDSWAHERLEAVARWIEARVSVEAVLRFRGNYLEGVRDGPALETG